MFLGLHNFNIRKTFYENCIIPRRINEWDKVIKQYSPEKPIILPSIYVKEDIDIDSEINRLKNDIELTRKLLSLKLKQLSILQIKRDNLV